MSDAAQRRVRRNRFTGKAGEMIATDEATIRLEESYRTGTGSDYLRVRRDPITNRVIDWNLEEDKTGKARLSKRQQETRAVVGSEHNMIKRVNRPHLYIVAGGLEIADNLSKAYGFDKKKRKK
jgi:hypothetical protein